MTEQHPITPPLLTCADCGCPLIIDSRPPYGWELEDGRRVCNECCAIDTRRFASAFVMHSATSTNSCNPY